MMSGVKKAQEGLTKANTNAEAAPYLRQAVQGMRDIERSVSDAQRAVSSGGTWQGALSRGLRELDAECIRIRTAIEKAKPGDDVSTLLKQVTAIGEATQGMSRALQ